MSVIRYRSVNVIACMLAVIFLILLISTPANAWGKKKAQIQMEGITSAVVLPFCYEVQTDFSKNAGTIASIAFEEGMNKKCDLSFIDSETVGQYMKENKICVNQIDSKLIKKIGKDLSVDCVIIGQMPEYDESETYDQMMDNREFGAQQTYTKIHYRNLRVKLTVTFYRSDTGESIHEFSDVIDVQDSAKEPMMPASFEVLLERTAKKIGKKLGKQVQL